MAADTPAVRFGQETHLPARVCQQQTTEWEPKESQKSVQKKKKKTATGILQSI